MRRYRSWTTVVVFLAAVVFTGGCGSSDIRTVNGTVDRVSDQSRGEMVRIKLEGDSIVYECLVDEYLNPECLVVKVGDFVTMQVGHKAVLTRETENAVMSLVIDEGPRATPTTPS